MKIFSYLRLMGKAILLFLVSTVTLGPVKKMGALYVSFNISVAIYAFGSAFGLNCWNVSKKIIFN